jgi:hypothetical protein
LVLLTQWEVEAAQISATHRVGRSADLLLFAKSEFLSEGILSGSKPDVNSAVGLIRLYPEMASRLQ